MHPDLMRSACQRFRFDQRGFRKTLNHSKAGLRRLAMFVIDHRAVFMPHVRAQRMSRDLLLPFGVSFHDRMIDLLCLMRFKLEVQGAMSLGIAGEDHHAARDLIQAMNDKNFTESLLQNFDKIFRIFLPSIWQNGKSCRFIYDNQVLVFMDGFHVCGFPCVVGPLLSPVGGAIFFAILPCLKPMPKHMIEPPKKKRLYVNKAMSRKSMA